LVFLITVKKSKLTYPITDSVSIFSGFSSISRLLLLELSEPLEDSLLVVFEVSPEQLAPQPLT
jgi:hypothetical protein